MNNNHVEGLKNAACWLTQDQSPTHTQRFAIAQFLRDLAQSADQHQSELASATQDVARLREAAHQLRAQLQTEDAAAWARYQQAEIAAAADRRAAMDERIALLGALDHERAKVREQRDQILALRQDLARSADYATNCRDNLAVAMFQLRQARNEADAQQLDALQGPDNAGKEQAIQ